MALPNACTIEEKVDEKLDQSIVLMNPQQMKTLGLYDEDIILIKTKRNKDVPAVVNSNASVTDNKLQMTNELVANLRYFYFNY